MEVSRPSKISIVEPSLLVRECAIDGEVVRVATIHQVSARYKDRLSGNNTYPRRTESLPPSA